jgi:uridine kinase
MKTRPFPRLVGIVGGSGAGKSWLAERLQQEFGRQAARLSLDDFYHDQSHLPPTRRAKVNFDTPRAIDWMDLERVLRDCRAARHTLVPRYNFVTHTRLPMREPWEPRPLVVIEGLWLLWRPAVRELLDVRIFLECPAQFRFERRLVRDMSERGRTYDSVRKQFWQTVAPMHERYVAPQAHWADIVLHQPPSEGDLRQLVQQIRAFISAASEEPEAAVAVPSYLRTREPAHAASAGPRTRLEGTP